MHEAAACNHLALHEGERLGGVGGGLAVPIELREDDAEVDLGVGRPARRRDALLQIGGLEEHLKRALELPLAPIVAREVVGGDGGERARRCARRRAAVVAVVE